MEKYTEKGLYKSTVCQMSIMFNFKNLTRSIGIISIDVLQTC